MAIVRLQTKNGENTASVASMTLAYNSNNTVGSLLVAICRIGVQPATATVSDSQGNTWVRDDTQTDTAQANDYSFWYAANAKAGANTITFQTSTNGSLRLIIAEYSGVALTSPRDQKLSTKSTGTSAASGAIVPTQPNELVVGWFGTAAGNTITATGALTQRDLVPAAPLTRIALHDVIQTSAVSVNATATYGSSDLQWVAGAVSFKSAVDSSNDVSMWGHAVNQPYLVKPLITDY